MTPDEGPDVIDELGPPEEIESRPGFTGAVWKKLAVTLFGLAFYRVLARIPLPGVMPLEPAQRQFLPSIGIFGLGLTPLIVGFLLVEMFAVLTPAGGRLREGGLAGRARLSRIALGLGLGMALIQGLGVGRFLTTVVSPGGLPYVEDPGPRFVFLTMLTLTAATAGLWVLGSFLSRAGLGNGFCLLIVFNVLNPTVLAKLPFTVLAAPLAVAVLLAFFFSRMERGEDGGHLPAFPQGVIPVFAVLVFLPWLRLPALLSPRLAVPLPPSWTEAALLLVLVPLLSWVAYLAVSGPNRLVSDLPGDFADATAEAADLSAVLRRRLPLATLVLTLGAAGLAGWTIWRPEMPAPLTFVGVAMAVATLFDLMEEARFTARNGRTERLLSLDNVYLAWHLTEMLKDAGIDALPRARRFRSLFFFFLPLVKIDLLVPAGRLEEAREVIAGEAPAVI